MRGCVTGGHSGSLTLRALRDGMKNSIEVQVEIRLARRFFEDFVKLELFDGNS
jgi:hypothetical protein